MSMKGVMMDPNENLKRQKRIACQITIMAEVHPIREDQAKIAALGIELAELVEALNEWIVKGGFLPKTWERK